ncbi:MAG: FKBP-type peptidyl-prolyl cis-trans isomerase [Bacteroidota bacterium]
MRNIVITLLLTTLVWGSVSAQTETMDSVSYSLGLLMANNLKQQGLTEIDAEELARGFSDMLAGNGQLDLRAANAKVQEHMSGLQRRAHEATIQEGTAFLAENAQRPEVQVTASGLQYEVLQEGDGGVKPTATSSVTVHYHGTLLDGTVFDSSVNRGETISFGLNQVIAGWTEGVQLMSIGDKFRFYIPYNLAYGEQGSRGSIPPFATLIFDVELLRIGS